MKLPERAVSLEGIVVHFCLPDSRKDVRLEGKNVFTKRKEKSRIITCGR